MARIRTLKPEHKTHRKVGPLSDRAYRLWVGMVSEADDAGRLVADLRQLRALVWAYHPSVTPADVENAMEEVVQSGLVRWYTVNGVTYAAFPSWLDHQKIERPAPSQLPAPPRITRGERPVTVREVMRHKRVIPAEVRRGVAQKYGCPPGGKAEARCHFCGKTGGITWFSEKGWVHFQGLELDHLEPEFRGGETTVENIVLSCRSCNRKRGVRRVGEEQVGITDSHPGIALDQGSRIKDQGSEGKGTEGIGSEEMPARAGVRDDPFERFWKAYPRHEEKQAARAEWARLGMSPELVETILAAVERQKSWPTWTGGYVPYARRWLKNRRWEDEALPQTKPGLMPKTQGNLDAAKRFAERREP